MFLIQYYHTVYPNPGRISPVTGFKQCRGPSISSAKVIDRSGLEILLRQLGASKEFARFCSLLPRSTGVFRSLTGPCQLISVACFETRSLLPSQRYLLCLARQSLGEGGSLFPFAPLLGLEKRAKIGLWDITKAETTPGNVPNAGRNMSASRARSSLHAILRLAKERRRANNARLRPDLPVPDGILLALLNQPRAINTMPLRRPFRPTPQDRATRCVPRRSRADISSLCHTPAHNPTANTKSPLPTATKDLLRDSPEPSVFGN